MASRRRGIPGAIPRLGRALLRGARWVLRHPQPLVACGLMAAGMLAMWGFATRSEAFRISDVQLSAHSTLKVPTASLIGRNLWAVDLTALASSLHAQQPFLEHVRVTRLVPNTLQIEVVERAPVAQVHLGGWHSVDREGFILPQARPAPSEKLVILKGAESPTAPLKAGRENTGERLLHALRLVERLTHSPVLTGHRVTQLDVADPKQLVFVIDEEVEIRCGSEEELSTHLARLRAVLQRVSHHPLDIRYIDLRFKDPVIGPRT